MDPYIGEIRLFAGNYAPENWAICDGRQLLISDNQPLFVLLGTRYGGNGTTTFALPDLRGRVPIGQGQGTGLTPRTLGQTGGTETVALNASQIPAHNHMVNVTTTAATTTTPGNSVNLAATTAPTSNYLAASGAFSAERVLAPAAVGQSGASAQHQNMMATIALNYIISLNGIFPVQP